MAVVAITAVIMLTQKLSADPLPVSTMMDSVKSTETRTGSTTKTLNLPDLAFSAKCAAADLINSNLSPGLKGLDVLHEHRQAHEWTGMKCNAQRSGKPVAALVEYPLRSRHRHHNPLQRDA